MHFNISSIEVDVIIEGWRKTIIIDDRDVLPLQDMRLGAATNKRVDISFGLLVANVPYLITVPVTIYCYNGARIGMELPSKVIAVSKDHSTVVELTDPAFSLVDLTPMKKSAKIIPVYNVTVPEPAE